MKNKYQMFCFGKNKFKHKQEHPSGRQCSNVACKTFLHVDNANHNGDSAEAVIFTIPQLFFHKKTDEVKTLALTGKITTAHHVYNHVGKLFFVEH